MPEDSLSSIVVGLVQELRQDLREQHARLRADMNAGFDRFAAESKNAANDRKDFHGRLMALETHVSESRLFTQGRLVIVVAIIAAITSGLFRLLDRAL